MPNEFNPGDEAIYFGRHGVIVECLGTRITGQPYYSFLAKGQTEPYQVTEGPGLEPDLL